MSCHVASEVPVSQATYDSLLQRLLPDSTIEGFLGKLELAVRRRCDVLS